MVGYATMADVPHTRRRVGSSPRLLCTVSLYVSSSTVNMFQEGTIEERGQAVALLAWSWTQWRSTRSHCCRNVMTSFTKWHHLFDEVSHVTSQWPLALPVGVKSWREYCVCMRVCSCVWVRACMWFASLSVQKWLHRVLKVSFLTFAWW